MDAGDSEGRARVAVNITCVPVRVTVVVSENLSFVEALNKWQKTSLVVSSTALLLYV